MERVSFDIERQEVADALHAEAVAHGRSVGAEVAALVERTYAATAPDRSAQEGNWVVELLALAKQVDLPDGLDPYLPKRSIEDFEPPRL